MHKLVLTGAIIILLAGCGGGVKELACSGNDWYRLGYDTATKGKSVRTFDSYRNQCGSNLEGNAMNTYLDGYTKGILEFCTYEKGYELGSSTSLLEVEQVRPVELRAEFNRRVKQGRLILAEKKRRLDELAEGRERLKEAERSAFDDRADYKQGR